MKTLEFENRKDWLEWRFSVITATDAPALMEATKFMSRKDCWAKKMGYLGSTKSTPQMRRGLHLEPIARKRYEEITGIEMPPACVQSTEISFIGATLDGLNMNAKRALEIKCPGKQDHEIAMRGEIPHKYIHQLVHTCMVTELPYCDYFSYSQFNGEIIIPFKRDLKLEEELLEEERIFWACVLKNVAPPPLKKKEKLFTGTYRERAKNILEFKRSRS